jgi:hypothetical protein
MPKHDSPTVSDLRIPLAARFLVLPRALTKATVNSLFAQVLSDSDARRVSRGIRITDGQGAGRFIYSFLCFRYEPPVPFLSGNTLHEIRYGFVLLIERKGYLAVFHRSAKGLDDSVARKSKPVDRRRLTHIWSTSARYQKLSTRRMTIARQELRGASYEADDLETALVPATAARSILQTIRMATQHGVIGITPNTGRVRVSSSKAALDQLVAFVDETIRGIETQTDSSFLSAFPESVELDNLPIEIVPVGLLVNTGELRDLLDSSEAYALRPVAGADAPDVMLEKLAMVFSLQERDDKWDIATPHDDVIGRLKRLKHSYSMDLAIASSYSIENPDGTIEPLDHWFRRQAAFSISFSSPEYFYATGQLYRKAGFAQEIAQVRRFLHVHTQLDVATSEKGGPYHSDADAFADDSIFRVVETSLAVEDIHLWCCDLGDEWADYIGVAQASVTFYHCKHGSSTTGASDFQIVVGQALKNLARVRFRREEMENKLHSARMREHWGVTQIPLLAKDSGGWPALERALVAATADPGMTWRVALVVTALSLRDFSDAAAKPTPSPYFIQLVWLLSAFISACRERDAQAWIYCRP